MTAICLIIGITVALALGVLKSPAAALPAAVFGPWSALAASVLAAVLGPPTDNTDNAAQSSGGAGRHQD